MANNQFQFEIPEEVRNVSLVLTQAGYENYLVGGSVRDLIRKNVFNEPVEPKDWDIATSAKPEEIVALFPKTFYENEFGTVGVVHEDAEDERVRTIEVTPFRLESEYTDKRHPDEVRWAKSIEEDLARRDFTINAIALNLQPTTNDKQLIDPFGGEVDIKNKTIRTVGKPEERFQEDALRLLRALRFAAELNFSIEHETQQAIEKYSDLLEHVSRERIRDEFTKIVMSDSPAFTLEMAARLDLLKFISPELEKGIGVEQNKAHAYNVWEHLLRSLDHAARKGFPLHIRLAALLHDVAKPHTRRWQNGQWTFYGHEVVGARIARQILTDLKFPKELTDKVVKLVRWHMFFSDTEEISLSAVRRMVRNVSPELIWDLMNVRQADRIGTGRPKETPYRLRKYKSMIEEVLRDPISVKQLKINGADIMKLTSKPAGPHIGFILDILLSEVLEDPKLNNQEHLEKRVHELHALEAKELEGMGREARQKNALEDEKEVEKIKEDYKVR
jgi:tRNA nucleotidyltransferase (CCA-adding enzyme)